MRRENIYTEPIFLFPKDAQLMNDMEVRDLIFLLSLGTQGRLKKDFCSARSGEILESFLEWRMGINEPKENFAIRYLDTDYLHWNDELYDDHIYFDELDTEHFNRRQAKLITRHINPVTLSKTIQFDLLQDRENNDLVAKFAIMYLNGKQYLQ